MADAPSSPTRDGTDWSRILQIVATVLALLTATSVIPGFLLGWFSGDMPPVAYSHTDVFKQQTLQTVTVANLDYAKGQSAGVVAKFPKAVEPFLNPEAGLEHLLELDLHNQWQWKQQQECSIRFSPSVSSRSDQKDLVPRLSALNFTICTSQPDFLPASDFWLLLDDGSPPIRIPEAVCSSGDIVKEMRRMRRLTLVFASVIIAAMCLLGVEALIILRLRKAAGKSPVSEGLILEASRLAEELAKCRQNQKRSRQTIKRLTEKIRKQNDEGKK